MKFKLEISMWMLAVMLMSWRSLAARPQQGSGEDQGQGASEESTAGTRGENQVVGAPSLAGPEAFAPGTASSEPSFFIPSFQIIEQADSNPTLGPGRQSFGLVERVVLNLQGESVGKHSRTVADYKAAAIVFNRAAHLNTSEHEVGLTWSYQGRRWGGVIDERASYLPESAFGYGGFGWGSAAFSNLGAVNPNFSPNQQLFSSPGSRIANETAVELQYTSSARSSLSMSAGYGLLTFRRPGSIDSRNELVTAAYNHSLGRHDYVTMSYGLNLFQFQPSIETFKVHFVDFDYGHRVLGKIAAEVGGGPQLTSFGSPLFGSDTTVSWVGHASLGWQRSRNSFSLSASRYASNGGGISAGTEVDLFQVSWNRQLTRKWSGSLGPGYSHNSSFRPLTAGGTKRTYASFYAGASLSRAFGTHTNMSINYTYQEQSSAGGCKAGNCTPTLLRHIVGVGFDWHRRQISLE